MTLYPLGEQLTEAMPLSTIGEPFTIDEIDKHPDAVRIWRTIQEVVNYHENLTSDLIYTQDEYDDYGSNEYEIGYDVGYKEGYVDGQNT